jgi:hypothetical protein
MDTCQFELLRQLSEDPNNVVVGLVRNKSTSDAKIATEIPGRKNISTIEGDITNIDSLKVSSAKPISPNDSSSKGTFAD